MKKIVVIMGSARKKATYRAVQEFENCLKRLGEYEFDYVFLNDCRLEFCCGCKLCVDKGREFCPLKDDRDTLLKKLEQSDGVVLATPNYAFQLSARMKNFMDRFAYIIHRPEFFGKVCTAVITQGVYGGRNIAKYLNSIGSYMGFTVTKGVCLTALEPIDPQREAAMADKIRPAAVRFNKALSRPAPAPSLFKLMLFRVSRTRVKRISEKYRDYGYYQEKGWFVSDYYYTVRLGPVKRVAGMLFDLMGRQMAKHA